MVMKNTEFLLALKEYIEGAEPIPAVDDKYLTWPGKDEGESKPPIICLDD